MSMYRYGLVEAKRAKKLGFLILISIHGWQAKFYFHPRLKWYN